MRIERQRHRALSELFRPCDQGSVTNVHAIEVSNRDRNAGPSRGVAISANHFHTAPNLAPCQRCTRASVGATSIITLAVAPTRVWPTGHLTIPARRPIPTPATSAAITSVPGVTTPPPTATARLPISTATTAAPA